MIIDFMMKIIYSHLIDLCFQIWVEAIKNGMAENSFSSREKELQSYEVSLLLLHVVQEVQVRRSRKMVTKEDDGGFGKVQDMDEDVRGLLRF